jgi:hypothetical protein
MDMGIGSGGELLGLTYIRKSRQKTCRFDSFGKYRLDSLYLQKIVESDDAILRL